MLKIFDFTCPEHRGVYKSRSFLNVLWHPPELFQQRNISDAFNASSNGREAPQNFYTFIWDSLPVIVLLFLGFLHDSCGVKVQQSGQIKEGH